MLLEQLARVLESSDTAASLLAIRELVDLGDPRATEILRWARNSQHGDVQQQAREALSRIEKRRQDHPRPVEASPAPRYLDRARQSELQASPFMSQIIDDLVDGPAWHDAVRWVVVADTEVDGPATSALKKWWLEKRAHPLHSSLTEDDRDELWTLARHEILTVILSRDRQYVKQQHLTQLAKMADLEWIETVDVHRWGSDADSEEEVRAHQVSCEGIREAAGKALQQATQRVEG